MSSFNRRGFLKTSGLSALPFIAPVIPSFASSRTTPPQANEKIINFFSDGIGYDPTAYLAKLQEINAAQPIVRDVYGNGGAVAALEKKFTEITGKEKAIFLPTGTMANQLAIHVLSGENPKVFVQETSHVYRDEADAAQALFSKRLIPLAKGLTGFTADELKEAVDYHKQGEVFASGVGAISIENPVRRTDGKMISIDELRRISAYCRQQGFKLHLDGARLYMASAWSGVTIAEYSALFDTVYISLYKYLGASAGAILCGSREIIDKIPHLMKIHGGTMFGNWSNAAMALQTLEGFDWRMQQTRKRADELLALLGKLPDVKTMPAADATNIHFIQLPKNVKGTTLTAVLNKEHNIRAINPNDKGVMRLIINETILYKDANVIADAFKAALKVATA